MDKQLNLFCEFHIVNPDLFPDIWQSGCARLFHLNRKFVPPDPAIVKFCPYCGKPTVFIKDEKKKEKKCS